MEQMKAQFKDSWQELKHLKTIVVTAMFIAIGVVLGFFFTIQVTDFLKIGFSFIANEMTALLFGPYQICVKADRGVFLRIYI